MQRDGSDELMRAVSAVGWSSQFSSRKPRRFNMAKRRSAQQLVIRQDLPLMQNSGTRW
jgi:hypothetical protein